MTDRALLRRIENIQQEWWEGDIESNVALSEIHALFRFWEDRINPICGVPGCRDEHPGDIDAD